jgi:hypothetical protein
VGVVDDLAAVKALLYPPQPVEEKRDEQHPDPGYYAWDVIEEIEFR